MRSAYSRSSSFRILVLIGALAHPLLHACARWTPADASQTADATVAIVDAVDASVPVDSRVPIDSHVPTDAIADAADSSVLIDSTVPAIDSGPPGRGPEWLALARFRTCAQFPAAGIRCTGLGQALIDHMTCPLAPCERTPAATTTLRTATQLSLGWELHVCALDAGTVRCWGRNNFGQAIPDSSETDIGAPTVVSGLPSVRQIAVADSHTCALLDDGHVRCWGRSLESQLGGGSVTENVPGIDDGVEIAAARSTTCVRRRGGVVSCWGVCGWGACGDATETAHDTPTPVPGITDAVQLTMGESGGCIVTASGQAQCWGQNSPVGQRPAPLARVVDNAIAVAAGDTLACALLRDGTVSCWDRTVSTDAVAVPGLSDATRLSCAGGHCIVVRADGSTWGWGGNYGGELGDAIEMHTTPVAIAL